MSTNAKDSAQPPAPAVKAPSPGVDNQQKDPKEWVTGGEKMTGAQASYLKTLCEAANQPFDASLSKADASRRIDQLRQSQG